jgi:hypothetical protein
MTSVLEGAVEAGRREFARALNLDPDDRRCPAWVADANLAAILSFLKHLEEKGVSEGMVRAATYTGTHFEPSTAVEGILRAGLSQLIHELEEGK